MAIERKREIAVESLLPVDELLEQRMLRPIHEHGAHVKVVDLKDLVLVADLD